MNPDFQRDLVELTKPFTSECAIVGVDGTIWASTDGFNPAKTDLYLINTQISKNKKPAGASVRLGEWEFLVVYHDPATIVCKRGNEGLIAIKCSLCFVLAFHSAEIETSLCLNVVQHLAKHISGMNY